MADKLKNIENNAVVGIITRHNVPNYGSILQAYATEEVLRRLGYAPYTVDYLRSQESLKSLVARYSDGRSFMHRLYRTTVWRLLYLVGQARFKKERGAILHLSESCNEEDFWDKLPATSVYLTGSDQVWNELGDGTVDGLFFWNGLEKDGEQRLVSYAASFGAEALTKGYEDRIKEWLQPYDAISVREDSGVKLVGQCGKKATQVLDPTLLLNEEEWMALAEGGEQRRRRYALVYNLHPDSDMLNYVKEKTRGSGLDVVSVCPTFRRRIGKHVVLPSLATFITLFKNAECVYTDSFHGTAFCINLKTPFVAIFPKENAARNHSVLRLFGLENRAWDRFTGNAWDKDIDWDSVHSVLNLERARSLRWLQEALSGEENG